MAIDDAAGRRAVRERRIPHATTMDSVFVRFPRQSSRNVSPQMILREDVHQRGLTAARKVLSSTLSDREAVPK